ncbi:MAG: ABC transporter ATP-binding protein [Thermoguttaceae bacterium]|jgi:zinc transport system ATP-binding protein
MSVEPVISLCGVSFSYGNVPVLENVCLDIGPRESVCVVGPNGGGKTTLVKLILGLLKPDAGEIRVLGRRPWQARLNVGYMPQHVLYDPQFPVTAMDIVLMGRLGRPGFTGFLGWPNRDDRQAALEALRQVDMEECCRLPFASLSGGQRQRVLVARAISSRPELLLLDEPTSNVDTLMGSRLWDLLRELNQSMTILMVTHDLGFVSNLVEKVICVNRRVVVHPTSHVTGEVISDIYGSDVRMVRHGDHLAGSEHKHE